MLYRFLPIFGGLLLFGLAGLTLVSTIAIYRGLTDGRKQETPTKHVNSAMPAYTSSLNPDF